MTSIGKKLVERYVYLSAWGYHTTMPWVGVAEEIDEEVARRFLDKIGLVVLGVLGVVELETSRGWLKFRVFEVRGSVEDAARVITEDLGAPAFESGPHLVLGEVSARLWDEGARVAFPDGSSEVVPIYTCDGFLDVRMPTRRVKGLKATIVVGNKLYELPLQLEDLLEIYALGQRAIEKIEKAASVYGLDKVVSRKALEEIRRCRIEEAVEVDYESGFVMMKEGSKVHVVSLDEYLVYLICRKEYSKLKELIEKAPAKVKEQIRKFLEEERRAAELVSDEEQLKELEEATERLGLQPAEEQQAAED